MPRVIQYIRTACDQLLPPTCLLCGGAGDDGLDLCTGCRADLPGIAPCCGRCALPLPPGRLHGSLCGRCQRRPPPFERCLAAFRYQDPLPALVAGIKFRGRMNSVRLLGALMADAIAGQLAIQTGAEARRPDAVIPVPLHRRRLRERGYNQALELARHLSRRLDLPIDPSCCSRHRPTPPQSSLERKARLSNVRGAFATRRRVDGQHLVIVDDVVTTASTVAELARSLRQAGAARIDVWCLARTP
jgi:ComF family protein